MAAAEAKKAKLKKLKEATKAKNEALRAEKASANASIIDKRPDEQAEELWDFVLQHKSVYLSELEIENLKLKCEWMSSPAFAGVAGSKSAHHFPFPSQTHSTSALKRAGSCAY